MAFVKWTLPIAAMAIFFVGSIGCKPSDVTETDPDKYLAKLAE